VFIPGGGLGVAEMRENEALQKKMPGCLALLLLVASLSAAQDESPQTFTLEGPAFRHILLAAVEEDLVILFADPESCVVTASRVFAERAVTLSAVCEGSTVHVTMGHNATFHWLGRQWADRIRRLAATATRE
jgi:hypothetical protein